MVTYLPQLKIDPSVDHKACLVVGNKKGFCIYSLENIEKVKLIYCNKDGETILIEKYYNSSLVYIVLITEPRKLKLLDIRKKIEICNFFYTNNIIAVRTNRLTTVVCLETTFYIYTAKMILLHTIKNINSISSKYSALSPRCDNTLLAYPGFESCGELKIFELDAVHTKTIIAHNSPLVAVCFSQDGTQIATASEKGTVIRVFSTSDCQKLFEFRRGLARCVTISSLVFSPCGVFLGCSSNTETVHIFKLEDKTSTRKTEDNWLGYFASFLPSQVKKVVSEVRAFATVSLQKSGVKTVISILKINNQLKLLVVTEEARLYIYKSDYRQERPISLFKHFQLEMYKNSRRLSNTK